MSTEPGKSRPPTPAADKFRYGWGLWWTLAVLIVLVVVLVVVAVA
ncbi:hypothetical protein [Mycobacterium colombiense]|nr:hypothetical protein [Mycobacterium colombiense]